MVPKVTPKQENSKKQNTPPRTLALVHFQDVLQRESSQYWHLAIALEYADRYWESIPEDKRPDVLRRAPGDDVDPFRRRQVAPAAFMADKNDVLERLRQHAIVAFVTNFEVYLRSAYRRALEIDPSLLDKSTCCLTAAELAKGAASGISMRTWLADTIADRFVRSRSPTEQIKRLDHIAQAGVSKGEPAKVKQWCNWTLLRNAIVHDNRRVTSELAIAWPDRFSNAGVAITLRDDDITEVSATSDSLAERLDRRLASTVVRHHDAAQLILDVIADVAAPDPGDLAKVVYRKLNYPIKKPDVARWLQLLEEGNRLPMSWPSPRRALSA